MKTLFILVAMLCAVTYSYAQNYPNIVNYSYNGTPTHGVKIITNIPYTSNTQMPTIHIKGYSFGNGDIIDISLVYYIYTGEFVNYQITSAGSYTPSVYLAEENSKVVIFMDDRSYYQRFTVSAFAQGLSEQSSWFQGWTTADESLNGTHTVLLPYGENLPGQVLMSNGIWNEDGSVGIGTNDTKGYKLAVNGSAIATTMTVKLYANWPDYVFKPTYQLPKLSEVKSYIDQNQRLPDMPSEAEVKKDGINLGEMVRLQTKKIEELTLYLIEKDKQLQEIKSDNKKEIAQLKQQLETLTKEIRKNQ